RTDPDPGLDRIRTEVLTDGEQVTIGDTLTTRILHHPDPGIRTVIVHPLKYADRVIGTIELEHHKRYHYRARDRSALTTISAQISTAIHIAELRRPLLETVEKIG